MRISVVGLGKLGAPLAAVLAHHGHDVTGVDNREDSVALLNGGRAPVEEPGLAAMIATNAERLRATTDGAAAAAATDVSFIIVPTPSLPSGLFSTSFVLNAIEAIGSGLCRTDAYHLVVVTSTVAPLTMDREVRPALERASGRVVGENLGLCYNPEFIALGSVIRDMCNPDFVLIGESDPRAGDRLEQVQRSVVGLRPEVRRMNLVNAEIAKIAVNTFVTTKISYANMLAEVCEHLPGGDVDVVTSAIGLDQRIGRRFFKGAVGYGGPCFPRDNAAFAAVAGCHGLHADLAVATDVINRRQVGRLAALVASHLAPRERRVAVLGLSYKPDTHVVEESQGVMLANHLSADGLGVSVFDPAALEEAAPFLHPSITLSPSLGDCLDSVDAAVITVAWPAFAAIPDLLAQTRRPPRVIIDCWRMLDPSHAGVLGKVVYIGRGAGDSRDDGTSRDDG